MYNAPRYQQYMYHAADNHPVNQQILDMISRGLLGGPAANMANQQRQVAQTIISAMNPMLSQALGVPDAANGWATLYRGMASNPATINVAGPGGGSYASFDRAQVHAAAASQLASSLQHDVYANRGNTNPYSGLGERTVMGMAADFAKRNPVVMHQEQMATTGVDVHKQLDAMIRTGKLKAGSGEERALRRQAVAMDTMQIAAIMEKERQRTGKVVSVAEAEKLLTNERYAGKDVFGSLSAAEKQSVRLGVREVSALRNRGLRQGDAPLTDAEFSSSEVAIAGQGNIATVDAGYTDAMKKVLKQQSKVVAELSEVFGTDDYRQITQNAKALHMKSLHTEQGLKEAKERVRQTVALSNVTNRSIADLMQEQADIGQQLGRHVSGASIMKVQQRAAAFAAMDERAGGQGLFNLAEMTAQSIQARTNNQNNAMGFSFGSYMLEKLSLDDATAQRVKALQNTMRNPESFEAYQVANKELLNLASKYGVDTTNEALKQYVAGHYSADEISGGKANVAMRATLDTAFGLDAESIGGAMGQDVLNRKDAYVDQATALYQLYGRDTDRLQSLVKAAGGDKSIEALKKEGFIDREISMVAQLRNSGLNMNTLNHMLEISKTNEAVIANADQMHDGANYIGNQLLEDAAKTVGSNKLQTRLNGRRFDIISGAKAFMMGALGMENLSGDEALSANLAAMGDVLDGVKPEDLDSVLSRELGERAKRAAIADFMSNSANADAVDRRLKEMGIDKNSANYEEQREKVIQEVAKERGYENAQRMAVGTLASDVVLTARKNENGEYEYSDEFVNAVIARSGTKFTADELRGDPELMRAAINNMEGMAVTERDGQMILVNKNVNDLITSGNIKAHEKFKGLPPEIAENLITKEDGSIAGYKDKDGQIKELAKGATSFTVGEDGRYTVKVDEKTGQFKEYVDNKTTLERTAAEEDVRKKVKEDEDASYTEKTTALASENMAKALSALYQLVGDAAAGTMPLSVRVVPT